MSVVPLRTRTNAETALIERAEAGTALSAGRAEAVEALKRDGLPTRRVEAWHYTDLRSLLGRVPAATGESAGEPTLVAPFVTGAHVVEVGSSSFNPIEGVTLSAPSASADWSHSPNHLDRPIDTVRLVNAAFGAGAVDVAVADGAAVEAPIELRATPGHGGSHALATVTIGAGASATIVERLSEGAAGSLSSGVSTLTIGDGANVLWVVDQGKGAGETHLGQLNVSVGADATFRLFVLNAGGALVRYEVHSATVGEGAAIAMRGVNLLAAGQHVDVTTTLDHRVPHTSATETFRNVVTGGHGVFQGMIKVSKGAQKTDARMACNSLLLSDEGDFSAKPELEIFADDVQCGHGATAGEINADHVFYLMSRGIPEAEANALLVKAFVAEVVEEIEDEAVEEALMARIDAWLVRTR
ncbi:Fe-S cluster assembly protein SufD [Aurantimonas sp. Leaf443]|uniref:Fe-S cluster assembly protein SufD n=1 Tax=Aurantimonas sp. Leaf443 TaxID=1736378 RepID=UPI0006FFEC6E|nr:Fe-S cluster assembly protein SufD [Aurantimonas sp. Leaf443]KQT83523.1 Fe-S cluster assembly protein SufD [Aurantimonas sp. Leaf443]